jgi:hypothetical protein
MGRERAAEGCPALELSRTSDRRDGNIAEALPETVEPSN